MVAELGGTFDPLLQQILREHLLERLKMPDFTTPEWRAWADEWREEVPLTREQERENDAWRGRVKEARERLAQIEADFSASLKGLASEFGVRVTGGGYDDEGYDVDDYDPPHKTTWRTKDGALPEPQHWKTIKFRWGTVPDGKTPAVDPE